MSGVVNLKADGTILQDIDLTIPNKRWQYPWQLVHRARLHDQLKAAAYGKVGPGKPARLHKAAKVVHVDPAKGLVGFADGSTSKADVIIGADGIYVSVTAFGPWTTI